MKKLAITVASAAVLASAANAAMDGKHFSGFYVGAHGGYGTSSSKTEVGAIKADLGSKGGFGGLHVGFGKEFANKMYLGLEAFGHFGKTKGRVTLAGVTSEMKRKNEFGAALQPGFVYGNALLFVNLGVASTDWRFANIKKKRKISLVPGLGLEMMATDHVKIGVLATQSLAKKRKLGHNDSIKPTTTDMTARISYKW